MYDSQNIFAKILRGEIPCGKVYEDEFCLAFNDINAAAPVHVIVIPKGEFVSFDDFSEKATPEFIGQFYKSVRKVANQLGLAKDGYRIIFNHGKNAAQSVFHYHVHILGGKNLGPLLSLDY
jgi:diadenosine tetraphosphate (Ap4A) HIT family hydrolase